MPDRPIPARAARLAVPRSARRPASAVLLLAVLQAALAGPAAAQIPSGIVLTPAFGSAGSGAFGNLVGMEEIPGSPGHFLV